MSLCALSSESAFLSKWRQILELELPLPTAIIDIIQDYTITLPREQFRLKYSEPEMYTMKCWKCGKISEPMLKELVDRCFKCECGDRQRESWPVLDYTYEDCKSCKTVGSYVDTINGHLKNANIFNACKECDNIDFCHFAERDDEICLLRYQCLICKEHVCKHNVAHYSGSGSHMCKVCLHYSQFGRSFLQQVIKKPPPTYHEFIQLLGEPTVPSPLPAKPKGNLRFPHPSL